MENQSADLLISGGGTGLGIQRNLHARLDSIPEEHRPLTSSLVIDTDEETRAPALEFADEYLNITTPFSKIQTYLAELSRLSPVAREILTRHESEFNSTTLGTGAGTCRYVTQFMMEVARHSIADCITRRITWLRKRGGTRIQPRIIGSNGGGTGSAVGLCLPYLLADPDTRARILLGCEGIELLPPVLYLVDVTCHVRNSEYPQNRNIQANAYLTNYYVNELLRKRASNNELCVAHVVMCGNGNSHKHFGSIGDVEAEMGGCLSMDLIFSAKFKSREVDAMYRKDREYTGKPGIVFAPNV